MPLSQLVSRGDIFLVRTTAQKGPFLSLEVTRRVFVVGTPFLDILEELQSQHYGRVFDASEPQLEQQIAAVTRQALPRAPNERKKSGSR